MFKLLQVKRIRKAKLNKTDNRENKLNHVESNKNNPFDDSKYFGIDINFFKCVNSTIRMITKLKISEVVKNTHNQMLSCP